MYLKPTTVYGSLIPGCESIRFLVRQGTMSKDAARRLSWVDFYNRCGDARLTCRHFAISPQTFYRWKNRFDPYDLTTLEAASRRPHHVRKPVTPAVIEDLVLEKRLSPLGKRQDRGPDTKRGRPGLDLNGGPSPEPAQGSGRSGGAA